MRHFFHELWFLMGETSPNGWPYLFWSGFGSTVIGSLRDLVLLVGAFHVGRLWRRHPRQVHHHHFHHYDRPRLDDDD